MRYLFAKIIIAFVMLMTVEQLCAQPTANRPAMVIGIMIDGLKHSHLEKMWNNLDEGGLKKIITQGSYLNNVSYNILAAGNASDVANVMTGSVPFFNGIPGNNFYSKNKKTIQSAIFDDNQIGIGTKLTYSAHHLLSSTIVDELMLAYPEMAKSYAVAVQPETALMMGGHTANAVAWVDDMFLKWVTTGYYTEGLSRWADQMNVSGEFKNIISRTWSPLFPERNYVTNTTGSRSGFSYDQTTKQKNSSATILRNTPAANSLVTELAIKIATQEQLGADLIPDILMLQYTVRTPIERMYSLSTMEKEDLYIRLDRDIQNLLYRVNQKIGMDKVLVVVFGNQVDEYSPIELGNNKIPAGFFNANRSMALLNSYLMAVYGQEKWVEGYYGKNIYLNKRRAEEKKINFAEMQKLVAEFMVDFEGVKAAYTSTQIFNTSNADNTELARIRNSSHKKNTGDVVVSLLPGWLEMDDQLNFVGESSATLVTTPVYFYGWKISPQTITKTYNTTDIAPTLSKILNITSPNASIGKTIEELIQK